jgi:hypothetical protein
MGTSLLVLCAARWARHGGGVGEQLRLSDAYASAPRTRCPASLPHHRVWPYHAGHSAAASTVSQVVARLLPFIINTIVARRITPDELGVRAAAQPSLRAG